MGIIHFDGFKLYDNDESALTGIYESASGTLVTNDGRNGAPTFGQSANNSGGQITWRATDPLTGIPTTFTQLVIGFARMWISYNSGIGGQQDHIQIQSATGASLLSLTPNLSTGLLQLKRGATVLATGTIPIITGQFWFIEMKFVLDDVNGSAIIRVNGVEDINVSGVDTLNAAGPGAKIRHVFYSSNSSSRNKLGEWYVRDYADGFLGDCSTRALLPAADTAQADWTPDIAGDQFSRLQSADGDTSYIETSTDGAKSRFTTTGGVTSSRVVIAYKVAAISKQPIAGSRQLKLNLQSNGIDATAGGPFVLSSSAYQSQEAIYDNNPDGNAPWLPATANAAEIGVEAA